MASYDEGRSDGVSERAETDQGISVQGMYRSERRVYSQGYLLEVLPDIRRIDNDN
ncbi:MAG: hypothetical protein IJI45_18465 [Anaerolineaceae bacterium]|nr:hypothetical protein [Anaerolineaceae bacterium]